MAAPRETRACVVKPVCRCRHCRSMPTRQPRKTATRSRGAIKRTPDRPVAYSHTAKPSPCLRMIAALPITPAVGELQRMRPLRYESIGRESAGKFLLGLLLPGASSLPEGANSTLCIPFFAVRSCRGTSLWRRWFEQIPLSSAIVSDAQLPSARSRSPAKAEYFSVRIDFSVMHAISGTQYLADRLRLWLFSPAILSAADSAKGSARVNDQGDSPCSLNSHSP